LELWIWFIIRVTSVVLLLIVSWHSIAMHIQNDVSELTYDFVVRRWSTPFWRSFDWLLLSFGLVHGTLGMRTIIQDYVRNPRLRLILQSTLVVSVTALLVLGSIVLFTLEGPNS
jgi:succinate dehydrogenase / fumarate reductase membrane anchor subunit